MVSPTQTIGFRKEAEACAYLQKQGLSLIQQQFHCRYGEIDLVMQMANVYLLKFALG